MGADLTTAASRAIAERPAVRSLVRACASTAIGALDRTSAARVVAREWSDDRGAEWLTRGAVNITDTASAPPLIQTVMPDIMATLAPTSVAARLFREGLQLKFDRAGNIAVPTILGDSAYASFVQEGKPIPVPITNVEPLTFLAPDNIASVLGDVPEVTARHEAAMRMDTAPADTDPLSRSMWQTDCVGVMVRLPVTWGVRSSQGVAWLVTTNW
jgi:hypothetical protein